MDLLEPVGRSERRHWGAVYIRGLLLNGERKSIEPLADRSNEGNVQALQQFVGQSPWDWMPLWERLSKRMTAELEPDSVWVIDDTGFAKQGKHSVGVARQYSGTLGKVGNCQIAVYLAYASSLGHALLDGELYLPKEWTNDPKRCAEATVPKGVEFQTKGDLAFVLLQRAKLWGHLQGQWVTGDCVYGSDLGLRDSLDQGGWYYVLEVPKTERVFAGGIGVTRPS